MLRQQTGLVCMQEVSERTMTAEIIIREACSSDISLLSSLIRESFAGVARRFKLTLETCPKHPSNCADEWIEKEG